MNVFINYIREFFKSVHIGLFLFCLSYTAIIVFLNYRFGIEPKIVYNISNRLYRFTAVYLIYLAAFAVPYLMVAFTKARQVTEWKFLLAMVLAAPAIFALKVSSGGFAMLIQDYTGGIWGKFAGIIVNWPYRLLVVLLPLLFIWWRGKYEHPFFGVTMGNFDWKPYLFMLVLMIPLIMWASTQSDFLHTYPKLKQISFIENHTKNLWFYRLLFELSYGIDFVTIELFFRGFLVLAFVRFAGQDAILPMAVFYCSIHFGKPLAECISSFFGGLLLGIIVYHTKSIAGGLFIHVGLAWLMEIGAMTGHFLKNKA